MSDDRKITINNEAGRAVCIHPTLSRPMKPGTAVMSAMLCLLALPGVGLAATAAGSAPARGLLAPREIFARRP